MGRSSGTPRHFLFGGNVIYADIHTGQWHFAMANAQGGGWPFDYTSVANQAARFAPDAWTRLTAVYNAGSGLMSLYVNGVLASTGHHAAATSPAPSGPIVFRPVQGVRSGPRRLQERPQ
ncbi:LamG-like jellyroll fold domain-containing protein [Streptomyces sp. NPDC006430]|uniref:LamG-like jellyroll fold domain-containing protein n=1 Tax=Streptomyces sp. NPDC006430 TaxID=3154299 RepID=UPI00339EB5BA